MLIQNAKPLPGFLKLIDTATALSERDTDGLYEDCQIDEYSDLNEKKDLDWYHKYADAAYKGRRYER